MALINKKIFSIINTNSTLKLILFIFNNRFLYRLNRDRMTKKGMINGDRGLNDFVSGKKNVTG